MVKGLELEVFVTKLFADREQLVAACLGLVELVVACGVQIQPPSRLEELCTGIGFLRKTMCFGKRRFRLARLRSLQEYDRDAKPHLRVEPELRAPHRFADQIGFSERETKCGDGFRKCVVCSRPVGSAKPELDRLLGIPCAAVVMGDEGRLARAAESASRFQGLRDLRVQRLAPCTRQAFVGGLLDERMGSQTNRDSTLAGVADHLRQRNAQAG